MNLPADSPNTLEQSALRYLAWLGLAMMLVFGVISLISQPFEYSATTRKPILEFVGLLIFATVLSIFAVRIGMRVKERRRAMLWFIFSMAIGFRAVMCFTPPVLEIDFYRYLWDGKVSVAGVSPYSYSPQQILDAGRSVATARDKSDLQNLDRLVSLSLASAANHEILNRVHFPNHTTIYPPVSQVAFQLVAKAIPDEASLATQLLALRIMLLAFDFGTILVLLLILNAIKRNAAWLIAYAWNPLVIKEISNSIHLDSIAIFFMMLAIWFTIRARGLQKGKVSAALGGFSLGMAVGAKLFPIVVAPAITVALLKGGWSKVLAFSLTFLVITAAALFPMFSNDDSSSNLDRSPELVQQENEPDTQDADMIVAKAVNKDGLTGFLSSWRMNDAIFSTVYHNLKPTGNQNNEYWYVVVPNQIRRQLADLVPESKNPAFLLTRLVTLAAFAIIYLCMLRRFYSGSDQQILTGLLYVLFAFLLLQPTFNPWYWVWVIPLTCFSNRWGWIGVSGILSIYYTRFFFLKSDLVFAFGHRSYQGVQIFEHFVVWGEVLLILLVLWFSGRVNFAKPDQQHSAT